MKSGISVLLFALLAIPSKAQPPQLFSRPTAISESQINRILEPPFFSRGELLRLNIEALIATTGEAAFEFSFLGSDPIAIKLKPLQSPAESTLAWFGVFEGGTLLLVLRPSEAGIGNRAEKFIAAGTIHSDKEVYQIRQVTDDQVVVREVDTDSIPRELEPLTAGVELKESSEPINASVTSLLDLAVFYTARARDAEGGAGRMDALIDLAVAETNKAFEDSRINARVAVVHRGLVGDDETGGVSAMLPALQNPSDGRMDEVHGIRNSRRADLVMLICQDMQYCGLAYVMQVRSSQFEKWAFSVVNRVCAGSTYTFAHEIGHNLGCCHDAANPCTAPIYPYAFGWHFNLGLSGEEVRTIMAYDPGRQIPHFSNPRVSIGIYPTGQDGVADNATTINNTAGTAATFR